MIHRMKVVQSLSSMKTWKFEKGGPCEKGETAAKSGCTPASGESGEKEGGGGSWNKLSPKEQKEAKKLLSKMAYSDKKIKSLQKSIETMKKWNPPKAQERYEEAVNIQIGYHQKVKNTIKAHMEKHYKR